MHKIYTLVLGSFLLNFSVSFASNSIDSIGVENNNGKKLIIYKVDAKETYYSISRKYGINPKEVMTYNDNKFLQVGVIIKVPTELNFTAINIPSATNTDNSAIVEYAVIAKDNLNLIAEKFGTTVNEIKRVNGLNSINLQIGQVLKIPSTGKEVATTKPQPVQVAVVQAPPKIPESTNTSTATYTVKPKDNLNLIAEKFGTTVEEIKKLNGLTSSNLSIGQVLKLSSENVAQQTQVVEKVIVPPAAKVVAPPVVSTVIPKATVEQPVVKSVVSDDSFEYTVAAGESIYSIAKKYGLTTYQIKTANNLTKNDVIVGQKLIIKGNKSVAETTNTEEESSSATTIKDPSLKYPASKYGITKIEEKGTAVWIADQDLDPSKMLVLHRTAPIGTIINITNPMTNRTTFAKVVGKFTENETTKDVIIVMTKAVADAIGALDKRFFCNINYGAQENEQQ